MATSTRTMRLECVKIAANIVCQLKDPKISVVTLARQFMVFIDERADEDEGDKGSTARSAQFRGY